MKEKFKKFYWNLSLASKMRYTYILFLVPLVVFLIFCFYNIHVSNRNYEKMIDSAVIASDFSLDFKKDFDYETYLLIIGNKSVDESPLQELLEKAEKVVGELEKKNSNSENALRLESVDKYLTNLSTYLARIENNLSCGGKYEENIEIWENDVQIVTGLIRETMLQYIYYEIKNIQTEREEYNRVYVQMINISVIIFIMLIILLGVLSYYIPRSMIKPIRELCHITDCVAKGDLEIRSHVKSGAEVGRLSASLNTMIDKINELIEQVTKEQTSLRKAELELLQAQINPHFLYNTLDTIIWLAEAGEQKKVVSITGSLSDFFRSSLNAGKDMVTMKDELLHVRSYLEIQQMRYQDILEYEIKVPEILYHYRIPKITIQPIVENALYHGIKNKRGMGKIIIDGEALEDGFLITVSDNGIGMDENCLNRVLHGMKGREREADASYGLYNVNERICLFAGKDYGVDIQSVYGQGTQVSVHLPY